MVGLEIARYTVCTYVATESNGFARKLLVIGKFSMDPVGSCFTIFIDLNASFLNQIPQNSSSYLRLG
jgi:hypothetical protein